MSKTMNRRQWLARSSTALGGTLLAGYGGLGQEFVPTVNATPNSPIRMMFNENPYGPSQVARKAMIKAFDEGNLYSGEAYNTLRKIFAEQVGVSTDHVIITSGSREVLNVAGLVYGIDKGEIIVPHPTYSRLYRYAERMGATIRKIPLDEKLHFDLDGIRKAMNKNVKLVYLCNPNNPTATITHKDKLRDLCEELSEDTCVMIDEAYFEYVTDSNYATMIDLVKEGKNIIVTRTASKIHGLAGLRVGFGIADPEIIRNFNNHITGSTNIIGLRAAIASFQDKEFQEFSRQKNLESREIVYKALEKVGRRHVKSHTNFVFFHIGQPIREFQKKMEKHGIIVGRPFPPYEDWCRLSMAKPEEMKLFASAFEKVMGGTIGSGN